MNNSFSTHVWHQIVERYIEASGIAWTHLHPNVFMENLLTFFAPRRGALTVYWGEQRADWVALSDVAAAAATVLREGPTKHHGKDYWMSTEALSSRMVWKKPFRRRANRRMRNVPSATLQRAGRLPTVRCVRCSRHRLAMQ
jgi:uncharacterized protein YbjT (DUF2867 family)